MKTEAIIINILVVFLGIATLVLGYNGNIIPSIWCVVLAFLIYFFYQPVKRLFKK